MAQNNGLVLSEASAHKDFSTATGNRQV